jgi:hypothetical protein
MIATGGLAPRTSLGADAASSSSPGPARRPALELRLCGFIPLGPLGLFLLTLGLVLPGTRPCRAETDLPLAYLRGQHRVVFRVIARGSDTPPPMPDHCTLTFTQRVLAHGTGPEGAYVDLEVRTVLPASIETRIPYPINPGSLPDSIRSYLKGTETRRDRAALDELLASISATWRPYFQDEMAGKLLAWVVNHVKYDSTTALDQSPQAVLQRQSGSCAGFAELTVALLRRAGIPARRMGCVVPPDCGWGQLGRGGRHAFIEIYYADVGWLPSDPLRSLHFVDPFHLVTRIFGRGASLGYDTLDFLLLEDSDSMQLAALLEEPGVLRWSAVLRSAGPDTCTWVPYAFRHRRLDGSFVHVGVTGDRVISFRDGRREFAWVWGDRETYDAANNYRFVEAEAPWHPRRIVQRDMRDGRYRFFPDGRRELAYQNGALEIRYPDGTRTFRSTAAEGYEKTTAPDGREEIRFANGTRSVRAADGSEQVDFPNGDRKLTLADGTETYFFSNGDKQTTFRDGSQSIEWANGARQTRTSGGMLTVERRPD